MIYRKLPVEVEAEFWDGTTENATQIIDWIIGHGGTARFVGEGENHHLRRRDEFDSFGKGTLRRFAPAFIAVSTIDATARVDMLDWVIRGVTGEFYPCTPDIFNRTYEVVAE